jgi:hypothetical protein
MKRYLFAISLFFICAAGQAQSLTFGDLLNLTSMTNDQAHDFLTLSKGFKSTGVQVVDGKNVDQYKITHGTPENLEIVLLGVNSKGPGTNPLRTVTYTTTQEQDINNLLAEAKKSALTLVFQGSDVNKNIYRFDNSLFKASISLSFDKKSGSVEVQQQ